MAPTGKKRGSNGLVLADADEFRCPYTGNQLKVEQVGDLRRGFAYRATGGFDPTQWHNNAEDLTMFIGMRRGVARGTDLVCAYTGAQGQLVYNPTLKKFRIAGVFGPSRLYTDRARLEYELSFRNGVPQRPEPKDVKVSVREVVPPAMSPVADLVDGARATADAVTEALSRMK